MKQHFEKYSHDLAYCAVAKCFHRKWGRNDVLCHIEEWAGYAREILYKDELEHGGLSCRLKYEITEELAYAADDMIDGIMAGIDPDLDAVAIHPRADGATGKIRDVAYLCIRHQILGHIVKLGLEPLLHARILPTQHASIPGRGQTGLARQLRRFLNRKLGIKLFEKTDCTSAYASMMYAVIIEILKKEIPRAVWIIRCMRVLEKYAPGGHLIIGGYLDAWLFNLAMAYALRQMLALEKVRRGQRVPMVIRAAAYMDDCCLDGRSETAIYQATKYLREWLWKVYRVKLRTTTGIIRLYSIEDEKRHKAMNTPARRGVPMIDMGGYRISRTHITMRRRNAKRAICCFLRAWKEYKAAGTLKRQRAAQIIARNGMLENCNSFQFRQKYHVDELMRVSVRIRAYWSRQERKKRKENIERALQKYRIHNRALCGFG